jgi:hypothetical protein
MPGQVRAGLVGLRRLQPDVLSDLGVHEDGAGATVDALGGDGEPFAGSQARKHERAEVGVVVGRPLRRHREERRRLLGGHRLHNLAEAPAPQTNAWAHSSLRSPDNAERTHPFHRTARREPSRQGPIQVLLTVALGVVFRRGPRYPGPDHRRRGGSVRLARKSPGLSTPGHECGLQWLYLSRAPRRTRELSPSGVCVHKGPSPRPAGSGKRVGAA